MSGDLLFSSVRGFAITITMAIAWFGAAGTVAILWRAAVARFGSRRCAHPWNCLADQPLDGADRLAVDRSDDGDRDACPPGATGSADAVDVIIGMMRHVKIEDMADLRNIEPAGRDVRSDQHRDLALAERLKRSSARRLVHVAMQRRGVELVAQQRAVQLRDFPLPVAEDNGVFKSVGRADQIPQRLTFFMRIAAR